MSRIVGPIVMVKLLEADAEATAAAAAAGSFSRVCLLWWRHFRRH